MATQENVIKTFKINDEVFKELVEGVKHCVDKSGSRPVLRYIQVAVKEKSVEMVQVKELLSLTGYIRGGCSPVGMKKRYPTVVDVSALEQAEIVLSAGKIGEQIELSPENLKKAIGCEFAEITHKD